MNIAAKAALKKRTGMTAADNDLGSTAMAGQAHAVSTALAGPGVAAVAAPAAHSSGQGKKGHAGEELALEESEESEGVEK